MSTIRGYPDYMTPFGAAPSVLFAQTFLNSNAVTVLNAVDVSSWPVVQLTMDLFNLGGGATNFTVRYSWSNPNDTGLTQPFKNAHMVPVSVLYDSTPNYGSNLTVSLDPNLPAGTFTGTCHIVARNNNPSPVSGIGSVINMPVQLVGAGAIVTTQATLITPGPANLYVASAGTPMAATVDVLTFGGVWTEFVTVRTLAGGLDGDSKSFDMPSSHLRLRVQNRAGVGNLMTASVIQRGY